MCYVLYHFNCQNRLCTVDISGKKHKSFITLTSEFNQKCSTPNTEKKVVHLFFGSLSQLSVE